MVSNPTMIGQSSDPAEPGLPDSQPTPSSVEPAEGATTPRAPLDPTRYGDWEKNGRCIDF
jgi:hypothetical protein